MSVVFGTTGRRATEILVGLFALLGFVCVPLGQKTGFEHVRAIAATGAAREAARDLLSALTWARSRLFGAVTESEPAPPAKPGEPQPKLPKLGSR